MEPAFLLFLQLGFHYLMHPAAFDACRRFFPHFLGFLVQDELELVVLAPSACQLLLKAFFIWPLDFLIGELFQRLEFDDNLLDKQAHEDSAYMPAPM